MASQTGEVEISSIEGTVVRGWFRSINDGNVYTGGPDWGAMLLYDAFSSLVGRSCSESAVRPFIKSVVFETPNATSTRYTLEVTDASVLAGLETGYWESYYLG